MEVHCIHTDTMDLQTTTKLLTPTPGLPLPASFSTLSLMSYSLGLAVYSDVWILKLLE